MGFWNQVRAVLSVPAIICIFLNVFGSCCPLIVSLRTCRSCSTRDGAKFVCGVGRNYFCHRRWEWEMAASPAGAGKGCCLVQTSPFGAVAAHLALQPSDIKQRMGMNTLIWVGFFFFLLLPPAICNSGLLLPLPVPKASPGSAPLGYHRDRM